MALFAVTRYQGEEHDKEKDKQPSTSHSSEILKRIHEQAEIRKKSQLGEPKITALVEGKNKRRSTLDSAEIVSDVISTKKRKKHKKSFETGNCNLDKKVVIESSDSCDTEYGLGSPLRKKKDNKKNVDVKQPEFAQENSLNENRIKTDVPLKSGSCLKTEDKDRANAVCKNDKSSPLSLLKKTVNENKSQRKHKDSLKLAETVPTTPQTLSVNYKDKYHLQNTVQKIKVSEKLSRNKDNSSESGSEGENAGDSDCISMEESSSEGSSETEDDEENEDEGNDENGEEGETTVASGDESGENIETAGEQSGIEDEGNQQVHQEIGGFTIIGQVKPKYIPKVSRVLPDWLAKPAVFSADLGDEQSRLADMVGLDHDLIGKLKQNGIKYFFPVQKQVIPVLLDLNKSGLQRGQAGYRPHDICCSAPTGSGKTLAFVLPIVQTLKTRVVCQVRALAVLPVRELASQVYKVFQTYCQGTSLKVKLISGQQAFGKEQDQLVKTGPRGYQSQADIVVATPGRLVDHLNLTPGFSLQHLRYLVIDEADRVMEEIKQDWLAQVEKAIYTSHIQQTASGVNPATRLIPGPNTAASAANMNTPLQKLLFSATLSHNPEKLEQLKLFQPKLFTSSTDRVKLKRVDHSLSDPDKKAQFTGESEETVVSKYTTPVGLKESFVTCSPARKPLVILHFLHDLKFRHILCFTNSREATHRLHWLVKLVGGVEVREFSARLSQEKRKNMLRKFAAGKIDLLICSDAMARGMDIDNVEYVISYESPRYLTTYIHRVGRCARAGKTGTAIALLEPKQIHHFRIMTLEAGKSGPLAVKEKKLSYQRHLLPHLPKMESALSKMPDILKAENRRKSLNK